MKLLKLLAGYNLIITWDICKALNLSATATEAIEIYGNNWYEYILRMLNATQLPTARKERDWKTEEAINGPTFTLM